MGIFKLISTIYVQVPCLLTFLTLFGIICAMFALEQTGTISLISFSNQISLEKEKGVNFVRKLL